MKRKHLENLLLMPRAIPYRTLINKSMFSNQDLDSNMIQSFLGNCNVENPNSNSNRHCCIGIGIVSKSKAQNRNKIGIRSSMKKSKYEESRIHLLGGSLGKSHLQNRPGCTSALHRCSFKTHCRCPLYDYLVSHAS